MPRAPQDRPASQAPQEGTTPPQPLEMAPHSAPAAAHTTASLPGEQSGSQMLKARLQVEPAPQEPQSVVLEKGPQPSQAVPHW
jgi:hypothetical protein